MSSFTSSTNGPLRAALRKCGGENNQMNTFTDHRLIIPAKAFLADPSRLNERKLLKELQAAIKHAGYSPLKNAFVEPGSVEHGIVHVFHDYEAQACVEISPRSGTVTEVL